MICTAGIDVGSTYAKAVILNDQGVILGHALNNTGFKLVEVARQVYQSALESAGLSESGISYVVATGFGRHMVPFSDTQVTDLTASARGATFLYPGTRTILDIGGQTMKASGSMTSVLRELALFWKRPHVTWATGPSRLAHWWQLRSGKSRFREFAQYLQNPK
jgi:activator of 2-hydroxyglutaryl-CoA dehydratase